MKARERQITRNTQDRSNSIHQLPQDQFTAGAGHPQGPSVATWNNRQLYHAPQMAKKETPQDDAKGKEVHGHTATETQHGRNERAPPQQTDHVPRSGHRTPREQPRPRPRDRRDGEPQTAHERHVPDMPSHQVETVKNNTVHCKIIDAVCATTRACLTTAGLSITRGIFRNRWSKKSSLASRPG